VRKKQNSIQTEKRRNNRQNNFMTLTQNSTKAKSKDTSKEKKMQESIDFLFFLILE